MKKALIANLLLVVCLTFVSTAYSAGQVSGSYVEYVRVDRSGKGIIRFVDNLYGSPASCISNGHVSHLSFDTNTPGGKAIHSLALSALLSEKTIRAKGTGTCEEYSSVESWSYGWVID